MKLTRLFVFILLIGTLFSSCRIPCAGFPKDMLDEWVPYKKANVIRFQSGSDQIVFEIDSTFTTKAYSRDVNFEEGCIAYHGVNTNKNQYPYLGAHVVAGGEIVTVFYILSSKEQSADKFDLAYNAYNKNDSRYKDHYQVLDTIVLKLGNKNFDNVLVIKNIETNDDWIKNIYLHKEKGLVGFIDTNEREYKLVE